MTAIVIAARFDRAREIARQLGNATHYPTTPNSIKHFAFGRGLEVDEVLVDPSAWPLEPHVQNLVEGCLIASGGTVRLHQ